MPDSQDPLIPLLRDLTRGMCNDLWVQDAARRIREVVAGAIPCRERRGPDICADAGQCGLSASMEDVAGETTLESVRREAREAALREAMEAVKHIPPCPFDGPHKLKPEDPCPICGDLGTFDQPDNGSPTRCQSAWAAIRALLSSPPPERAVDPTRALAACVKVLRAYERWEAKLIMTHSAWSREDGLPSFTDELWNSLMEIQGERNAALVLAEHDR